MTPRAAGSGKTTAACGSFAYLGTPILLRTHLGRRQTGHDARTETAARRDLMATVVLYAVDLEEMRRWVGSGDAALLGEGLAILREDEEADWEPEEVALLERLLRRMVFDGRLYEGLAEEERYYLTQLLVDLFDE